MRKFTALTSTLVPLDKSNIDTDQIIPARFLKGTTKEGLGTKAFFDWRTLEDGSPNPDFVLNQVDPAVSQILIAGDNFGCGSSREHAPWALADWGLRAIVSTSFADIFCNNALKNGLLPVAVPQNIWSTLMNAAKAGPTTVSIDLESQTVKGDAIPETTFPIDRFSKRCLLEGVDSLGYLLKQESAIAAHERSIGQRT